MKTRFLSEARLYPYIFSFLLITFLSTIQIKAQTICTNSPASCATALLDLNAVFVNVAGSTVNTVGTGIAPVFTLSPEAASTSTLSVHSGLYQVTTDNCVLVAFTETRVGLSPQGPTSVSIILPDLTVIECANVSVGLLGAVCVQICDPRIDVGQLIRVQLNFSVNSGNFNNETVAISAFALLNLTTNTTCAATVICLPGTTDCTPCNPLFPIATGKIRVFFTSPIPVGVATPTIGAAATLIGGITTPLTQFAFCVTADAGTNVVRTYADYCVYSTILTNILPVSNLVLTLQSGSFPGLTCPVSLPALCPTGFTTITDTRPCLNCDPAGYPNIVGKVRIFFPTEIPAGMPNPIVSAIAGTGITVGSLKLCALADAGTNLARTYADYCVYTNLLAPFTLPLSNPLTFSLEFGSCGIPQLCVVTPTVLPVCTFTTYLVIDNGNGGGAGGGLGTCASTSTCSGSTVFLASRLRVNLSTCLPAGIPAPSLESKQIVNADGTFSLLNQDYCINVSDESAAAINTERCFIEYCIFAKVNGNTSFVNPPDFLILNRTSTSIVGGLSTQLTASCSAQRLAGPTPVTIINFDYQLKNCGVTLKWSTAQETNSKEFVVQNSTDGINWTPVGKVKAQGLSGLRRDYSYVHPNPVNGPNFYRFAAVDLDGSTKYSEVLSLKVNCSKAEISVHPNPFTDVVNLYFTALRGGNVGISIRDNTGRTIHSSSRTVQSGSNTITINNLSAIPKGVYIISVKTDDAVINQKLVK